MQAPRYILLFAIPLIAVVVLVDQISKYSAISNLCGFVDAGGIQSCARLEGMALIQANVFSTARLQTFLPIIDLDFHLNTNAALSLPIPGPWWFEYILLLTIMGVLAGWLWREGGRNNAIGVGLILGGALGNFFDRLVHGAVVDFFALHFGTLQLFIFNVADAAITVGVVWLFIEQLYLKPRRQREAVVV